MSYVYAEFLIFFLKKSYESGGRVDFRLDRTVESKVTKRKSDIFGFDAINSFFFENRTQNFCNYESLKNQNIQSSSAYLCKLIGKLRKQSSDWKVLKNDKLWTTNCDLLEVIIQKKSSVFTQIHFVLGFTNICFQ